MKLKMILMHLSMSCPTMTVRVWVGQGGDLTFSKNECPTTRAILMSQNASTKLVNITFYQYILVIF